MDLKCVGLVGGNEVGNMNYVVVFVVVVYVDVDFGDDEVVVDLDWKIGCFDCKC